MKSSSALVVIFLILFLAGCGGAIYYFFFYTKDGSSSSGGGSSSSGGGSSSSGGGSSSSRNAGGPTAPFITSVLTFKLTSSPTPICPINSILVYNPALSSQITFNGVTVPLTTISTTSTLITANVSITGTTYAFSLNAQLGSATIGTNMFTLGTGPSSSSSDSSSASSVQNPPTQIAGYNDVLNSGIDGFDLKTGADTDINKCITNCNNINGCAGVQLDDNTGACSLKGAIYGTSAFPNTDYYFKYTNKALNFVIKNNNTGYFMCIEDGNNNSDTGLPGSYCDFSEGRRVNAVTLSSSSVIPAKAIWTYKGTSNFVNVLSGAFMYVDMTGQGALKITYDAQKAQQMTYKNGKINFSANGNMYSLQDGDTSILASSLINPLNSDWDIIYLPQQTNVIDQSQVIDGEVFFNIMTSGKFIGTSENLNNQLNDSHNLTLISDKESPNAKFSFKVIPRLTQPTLILRTNPKYNIQVSHPQGSCSGGGANIILMYNGLIGNYAQIVSVSGKGYMIFLGNSGACQPTSTNTNDYLCMGVPSGINNTLTTHAIGNSDGSISNYAADITIIPINNCRIGDLPLTSLYF
jgi:hypothetical protein